MDFVIFTINKINKKSFGTNTFTKILNKLIFTSSTLIRSQTFSKLNPPYIFCQLSIKGVSILYILSEVTPNHYNIIANGNYGASVFIWILNLNYMSCFAIPELSGLATAWIYYIIIYLFFAVFFWWHRRSYILFYYNLYLNILKINYKL